LLNMINCAIFIKCHQLIKKDLNMCCSCFIAKHDKLHNLYKRLPTDNKKTDLNICSSYFFYIYKIKYLDLKGYQIDSFINFSSS
jgi:hypothetical protein